jgi:uncharacterized protein YvpB
VKRLRSIPFLDYIILAAVMIGGLYLTLGPGLGSEQSPAPEDEAAVAVTTAAQPDPRTPASAAAKDAASAAAATSTPLPVMVPVRGKKKMLSLDCEARAAVDWAAYYDLFLEELEFQSRLPKAPFPDDGFVGSPYDDWGYVPPDSYGVHAGPVADVLRQYGLKAYPYRGLSWADIKRELDAGHPVIAWVVGKAQDLGGGQTYTAPDGRQTLVAPYEHTVIIVGYQGDEVIIVDGAEVYGRPRDTFLASWEVLGNMAILANPVSAEGVEPL